MGVKGRVRTQAYGCPLGPGTIEAGTRLQSDISILIVGARMLVKTAAVIEEVATWARFLRLQLLSGDWLRRA